MKKHRYIVGATIIGIALIVSFGIFYYAQWHAARVQEINMLTCGGNMGGGTIISIEGNIITAKDEISKTTVRIVVGSSTNYYEPDLVTRASSSAVIEVGNLVTANGQSCSGDPPTLDARIGYIQLLPILPDVPTPAGWYAHSQGINAVFFTKQADLPDVGATEGYAYGEQIDVSAVALTPGWANANIGNASGTIGAPPANDWGMLDGYQTIKAEIGTEADNELIYAIFDPAHYTVYEFILYPYPNATDTPIFNSMIHDFIKNL
jgi:hypothetical protein